METVLFADCCSAGLRLRLLIILKFYSSAPGHRIRRCGSRILHVSVGVRGGAEQKRKKINRLKLRHFQFEKGEMRPDDKSYFQITLLCIALMSLFLKVLRL